ncbi:prevent-host-death family protein [Allochromatium warmingii]|uniref:Antitoxin n=1 Tax=Allochromatium warmingii TaxID=61595 RepID=A0A1H3JGR1_ALLWA|nr:type II toxin-antitoxin system prevent-host-death family antitoxin [Allochromatium warmingii]SDY39180.1 prevent-host-death family protein [Allochromatium warmingii]
MITVTSREFNQETARATQAADHGPVFITDCGRPSYVLLSIADYQRLSNTGRCIADLLAMPNAEDIDLELPNLRDLPNEADLS